MESSATWAWAFGTFITAVFGFLSVVVQGQLFSLRKQVAILKAEHKECHDLLSQKVPSDAVPLFERISTLRAAMALEGRFVSVRDAALLIKQMDKKPA